ncbi:MAG: hypothetical protein ACOX7F_09245 [Eubacteriales bacterium]|jgi:hypothetical protein
MEILTKQEIERLRELGRQVAEIAADPLQQKHIQIWKGVNDFHMERPALLARDYPIFMLHHGDELVTTIRDEYFASVEEDLLLKIYEWKHMRLNRVILPEVRCHVVVQDPHFGLDETSVNANDITSQSENAVSSAKHFDRIIDVEEDLQMIQWPRVEYDEAATMRRYHLMKEIFDGILEVRLYGIDYFKCVPWDDLLTWMNIERGMYDFVLNPEFMHKAMRRYMDCTIARAKRYEELGLISSNNTNTFVCTGGYGFTDTLPGPTESGIGGKLQDNWGDCADQIMTSVSPAMCQEFAFDYEKEWTKLFHYSYYGCCERLDNKVKELETLGNLRKVSMSPFADLRAGMEKLGNRVVVSFKPNSNYLTMDTPRYDLLEEELVNACQWAQQYGCSLEIIMKTIITLRGEPQRLWKWCELATEVIDRFYN